MSFDYVNPFRVKYADMLKEYPDTFLIYMHTRDCNESCGTCATKSYTKVGNRWKSDVVQEGFVSFYDYFDIVNQIPDWIREGRKVKTKQLKLPYNVPFYIEVISPDSRYKMTYTFNFDKQVWSK